MRKDHPVWEVYNNYRTARLNVKYYSARLFLFERTSFLFDVVIAIAAPGSIISGSWFVKTQTGLLVWQCISLIAAIAGIIRPFLKLNGRIKGYEQAISGYRALEFDLYEIIVKIKDERVYSASCKKMFDAALKKMKSLVSTSPEHVHNRKLIDKLYLEVIQEIPSESFFVPDEVKS